MRQTPVHLWGLTASLPRELQLPHELHENVMKTNANFEVEQA